MFEADDSRPRVTALTAHENVYRTIRGEISAGRYAPGARLVQRQLAKQMGTSTIPVIDALRRLEGEGLLVTTPGIGTHVRIWKANEVAEIYYLRAALEGVAARLFAERAGPADVAVLEAYNDEFEAAVSRGSLDDCRATDERLHRHLARASRSPELLRLLGNSSCILLTIRNTLLPEEQRDHPEELGPHGVHDALIAALKSGDPERAERAGREHVLDGLERIRPFLREAPGQRP